MKENIVTAGVVFIIAVLIAGCAAKAPVVQDGKQVAMFVLPDRGIRDGMQENERNDRNEVGQFMEEDLINSLSHEGYHATLIQNRNQYAQGSAAYLVFVKINELHLVGKASRFWLGHAGGPTILNAHYEVSGSDNKLTLAYDDVDSTIRDWSISPRELNHRFVEKINDTHVGTSR